MPDQDNTQAAATSGPFPVYANPGDDIRLLPPRMYVDDPIAAAHWNEGLWHPGALGR